MSSFQETIAPARIALSVAEVATKIGVSKSKVRNAIRAEELVSHLVGRRRVLLMDDVLIWITGSQRPAQEENATNKTVLIERN